MVFPPRMIGIGSWWQRRLNYKGLQTIMNGVFTMAVFMLWSMGRNISGVVVTKPIFSVPLFSTFPLLSKQKLAIEYRVHIWQVSPQLSCGDTCQIWMWFRESNRYFCKIENFAYGEISERSFSNPTPGYDMLLCVRDVVHMPDNRLPMGIKHVHGFMQDL